MAFEWKDRYKLDIEEIDKQHRRLFDIGARVYDLAVLNDSYDHYDEIMQLIGELLDYTEYHFTFEENLLEKYNYGELDKQKQEHEFYVRKIKSISSKDIDEDQKQATLEIVDFLSEWISSHILFSDRKYAVYFKENGINV
ncbi:bacteriohemerythrin [Pseudoclostridium thermosuccinogenes]|jgi:hemerythrin|uniref:bacteriohemerythrin n=1 Tax=Clostridium thermosuccinogenes TaxID=84032 RepID=UPI000CCC3CB2|nr:bacteriohemerythrin [Pseudoclostridium thermosuccinogenes]PNT92663.1 bacteriohemerythrin [Pseudoclostridium thermosuccinogenes]